VKDFAALKRNLKRETGSLPTLRLALLADSATQLFVTALRGAAIDRGLALEVYEAPFNQIQAQIADPSSELYDFKPEMILLWQATEPMLHEFQRTSPTERHAFADDRLAELREHLDIVRERLGARVIALNAPEIDDAVFGSFAARIPASWVYQLRRYNFSLMELAASRKDLFIADVAIAAAELGRAVVHDRRIALTTELQYGMEFLPVAANRVLDVIDALRGRIHKCLILDLDNTLWGGVIGDDGMDRIELGELGGGRAYSELQAWAKALQERGIILAVCSKNDERIASEPFEKHPDMVLRREHIAVFMANWENKVDNIRHIQSILEIGFDSMVFLDDNPAEREIVKVNIPDLCVPELPEDPTEWLPLLQRLNLFETASYTGEDSRRTAQYQEETQRRQLRTSFADEGAFLASLDMVGTVEGFTSFNIPRVAQLTQRSNQFNLRTIRYDEAQIERMGGSERHHCFALTLEDKFGSHGLISVLIAEERGDELFIDTWLMSCRVLKRGVEQLALNTLAAAARRGGAKRLVGEYVRTAKNELVQHHYRSLGFTECDDRWVLDLTAFDELPHHIRLGATT